jgi:diguanylate cyclase (GGDEF)-like protein
MAMISTIAFPSILMSAICFYAGIYHFFVYIKRKQQKENLFFSFCCFCVALYDFFCFHLYTSDNLLSGIYWQRWQLAITSLISISLLWFVGFFVEVKNFRPIALLSIIYGVLCLLGLVVKNGLTLSSDNPAIKTIHLGANAITYYESALGLIYQIEFLFLLLGMVYFIYIFMKYRKKDQSKYKKAFFISMLFFFLGTFSDMFVSMRIYQFVYIAEYMYMFIILTMAFILSSRFADLYTDIETLNKSLEQKVKERTREIQRAYKKIAALAYEDPLTKLPNRRDILNKIKLEKFRMEKNIKTNDDRAQIDSFCLAICDIDFFKNINDSFGHDCGDFILKEFGFKVKSIIRKVDQIGRWGGEEFIFLFPNTNLSGGKIIAEKLRHFIETADFYYKKSKIKITITIGLVVFNDIAGDISESIKHADIALYKGKTAGRNRVVVF